MIKVEEKKKKEKRQAAKKEEEEEEEGEGTTGKWPTKTDENTITNIPVE